MCIIIDTNVLSCVFKSNSEYHEDFKPVKEWIVDGKGKIVFGGKKYINEIPKEYLALFFQLKKAGKAIRVDDTIVDKEQILVETMIAHPDFDDPHLVSLLRVSGCKLICSLDKRAYAFLRHRNFFKPSNRKPKIYSKAINANLLTDQNIATICKPCSTATKNQKLLMGIS